MDWGAKNPKVLFVGGVPSKTDLGKDKILSGTDGALLRNVLSAKGFDLMRDVGYTSVFTSLGAGPKPKIDDIRAVSPRLFKRIKALAPMVVVTLGNVATTALLGHGGEIGKRRGFCEEAFDTIILPSRHPGDIIIMPDGFPDMDTDIERVLSILGGGKHTISPPYHKYRMVRTEEDFVEMLYQMDKRIDDMVSVDIETTGFDPKGSILSIGLSWIREEAWVIDCQWLNTVNSRYLDALKDMLNARPNAYHNAQFDVMWLRSRGFDVNLKFDTMLANYVLNGRQDGNSLKRLAADRYKAGRYDEALDRSAFTLEEWKEAKYRDMVMMYNGADADYTLRLTQDLQAEMVEDGVDKVHDDILVPASIHFIRLKEDGLLVDQEYHDQLGAEWLLEIQSIEAKLRSFPGAEEMNFRSTKQVKAYLFDTLGLRPMGGKKDAHVTAQMVSRETKNVKDEEAQEFWRTSNVSRDLKSSSTGTYMLFFLAQQHEFPRLLVQHRLLTKRHGTYYEGYKEMIDDRGRICPSYKLHGTRTGRLSSTKPNIHGMPRKNDIKRMFIADPGYVLVYADYSQAEIRMVAHLAGDETLIAALDAQDIHREISKVMFSLTDEQLDALPEEEIAIKRRAAKTIAFGLIYGRGVNSIAPQLGVSKGEAQDYMDRFFEMMPKVATWLARQKAKAVSEHEVVSLYGRKRRFPLIASKSHKSEVQRQAGNFPVQSSVSDLTLLAAMRTIKRLENNGIECKIWPHIHDSATFQVLEEHEDAAIGATIKEFHAVGFETEVDFKVEVETGKNWGDLKVVYNG